MAEITKLERHRHKPSKCPICGRPTERQFKPFCSRRCADEDLGRWLGGAYRIPTEEKPEDADDRGQTPEGE